jgi:plasmid stabilization system protein ParE
MPSAVRRHATPCVPEAEADLQGLDVFAIEREPAHTPDWTTPQRALDALREGMRLLSWSPYTCRKADLGNGRSRELIVPFGSTGYVVLFEIVGDQVVVAAVRHQREEDYRH